ncbi:hypothetical protein AQZ52_07345 [Novosphingobium fuchskuhlense]|uniref:Uncharacterized protein n=1 Tax=Novosphingobium fuchskuhlense TaxID=1117702 RepID=A0A117UY50_9SPHN|nr:hypothetical protein [Novosphingobium fuchskuhlense]KUR73003.1 hypothetical protein AQZ52_07345 [Novosphingobium fuchskuhlense]
MRTTRRGVLKGGALAGAVAAVPVAAHASAQAVAVIVHDSRLAESASFAGGRGIDLAAVSLRDAQAALESATRVEGLTRWSDWTVLRGLLEEQGLRRTAEARIGAPLSGHDGLLRWSMAAR